MFIQILMFVCLVPFLIAIDADQQDEYLTDCQRENIYCHTELLHAVQLSNFALNSPNFIDKKLKDSPERILAKFKELKQMNMNPIDFDKELENFIKENFEDDNTQSWPLTDYKEMPNLERCVQDEVYREFYKKINPIWLELATKTPEDVKTNPDRHSMIYLPYHYIKNENSNSMPQSWENYLIIRGLLSNGMFETAEAIIRNYAHLIETNNFVPLSNRVYSATRSQLPLFALMVEDYNELVPANDVFLDAMIPTIEKEFHWWQEHRMVEVDNGVAKYQMFRYHQKSTYPRPEKYREDFEMAAQLDTEEERHKFYSEIRNLDESGFGFSSRFLRKGKYADQRLNLDVSSIIPVELNCVLYRYALLLSQWHDHFGREQNKMHYSNIAAELYTAIQETLWNAVKGIWFDWDITENKNVETYYITNLTPFFTITYDNAESRAYQGLAYLMEERIITRLYGQKFFIIPTSKKNTGEEADFPFGSLLLNLFLIDGLRDTRYIFARLVAEGTASMVVETSVQEFDNHKTLSGKYNAIERRAEGESSAQESAKKLGWAAGCIITLLKLYGKKMESNDFKNFVPITESSTSTTAQRDDEQFPKKRRLT